MLSTQEELQAVVSAKWFVRLRVLKADFSCGPEAILVVAGNVSFLSKGRCNRWCLESNMRTILDT